MSDLDGRVAIVTGAGRGIGRAYALALARAGASIVVNDLGTTLAGQGRDAALAEGVCKEIAADGGVSIPSATDVADFAGAAELVAGAVESFGRLDILVNNAGILRERMLVDMDEEDWDDNVRVHLRGHFAPIHHAAKYWRGRVEAGEQLSARIINTSSPSGLFGTISHSSYGAAKAGIAVLTLIAAQELAPFGVTVNCIAPSGRTRMTWGLLAQAEGAEVNDPLDPAHNASLIVALAGDKSAAITGQVFFVYGGTVTLMQPWQGGVQFRAKARWGSDELIEELLARFPNGLAPASLAQRVAEAGGPHLQA